MSRRPSSKKVCEAPMAVASDGTLVVGAVHLYGNAPAEEMLQRAIKDGATVFIGVVLDGKERELAMNRMTEASGETAARVWGQRQRRRRPVARRMRRMPS
jgi:hypothetical protein